MADFPIDSSAWQKLVKRISRKTSNIPDAEDFLHSAYLRFNNYKADHQVKDPSAFLVRAAINIGIDNFRHQRLSSGDMGKTDIEDETPLQDEVIAARLRLQRVKEGLAQLPPRTREVLLMRRLDGRGYDEIAAHMGISRSTVERTIAQATTFLIEWTKEW